MTDADLDRIHRRLTAVFPRALVLLGGSRAFGEAEEGSDADFYVVSWRPRLARMREAKNDVPRANVMWIPVWAFRLGRYYVWGRDLEGRVHRSGIDRGMIFRDSLKLGWHNLLKGRTIKAAKCIATARAMLRERPDFSEPIFSRAFFRKNDVRTEGGRDDLLRLRTEGAPFLRFHPFDRRILDRLESGDPCEGSVFRIIVV